MNTKVQLRELSADELLVVSGGKGKTFKETCTTTWYSDGTHTRVCVPDKK
jgi:hypothetical protein